MSLRSKRVDATPQPLQQLDGRDGSLQHEKRMRVPERFLFFARPVRERALAGEGPGLFETQR
jgi:hypothetical protein